MVVHFGSVILPDHCEKSSWWFHWATPPALVMLTCALQTQHRYSMSKLENILCAFCAWWFFLTYMEKNLRWPDLCPNQNLQIPGFIPICGCLLTRLWIRYQYCVVFFFALYPTLPYSVLLYSTQPTGLKITLRLLQECYWTFITRSFLTKLPLTRQLNLRLLSFFAISREANSIYLRLLSYFSTSGQTNWTLDSWATSLLQEHAEWT